MNNETFFTHSKSLARSTSLALILALPLGLVPAVAQESSSKQETMAEKTEKADAPGTAETGAAVTEENGAEMASGETDAVIATVGDAEILGSDVMRAIGMLPPRMREQPTELLLPMALQQLVLRELILDRARSENLGDDSAFTTMADQASTEARENIMVQYWLQQEIDNAVTDEAVKAAYTRMTENVQGDVPPLDAVRLRIVQELRRVAMNRIRADLQAQGPEISFTAQVQQESIYSEDSFCTAEYSPGNDTGPQAESKFAEMDLDGDGMVSQEEYQKCRMAAASK